MDEKIKAIKLKQGDNDLLVFGIPAKDLLKIAYYNPREMNREEGVQRSFNATKSVFCK